MCVCVRGGAPGSFPPPPQDWGWGPCSRVPRRKMGRSERPSRAEGGFPPPETPPPPPSAQLLLCGAFVSLACAPPFAARSRCGACLHARVPVQTLTGRRLLPQSKKKRSGLLKKSGSPLGHQRGTGLYRCGGVCECLCLCLSVCVRVCACKRWGEASQPTDG